jgi:hypothetical protein
MRAEIARKVPAVKLNHHLASGMGTGQIFFWNNVLPHSCGSEDCVLRP